MGCSRIRYKISLYIDHQLDERDMKKVKAHLNRCPTCRDYYRDIVEIRDHCSELGTERVPVSFYDGLRRKLYGEGELKLSGRKRRISVFIGLASVLVIAIVGISMINALGLGSMKSQSPAYDQTQSSVGVEPAAPSADRYTDSREEYMEMPSMEVGEVEPEGNAGWSSGDGDIAYDTGKEFADNTQGMIIKSAYLGVETLEFDVFIRNLEGKVKVLGGYIESSNIQGVSRESKGSFTPRRANYEIRIPSNKFEQFNNEVGELGNLITKEIHGENVTGQYLDTQARVKSLKIQEERLLSILEKAERLQDIIELESELSRVRYEIENYTGTLKRLEQMVNFSRIHVDVYEVKEIKVTEPDPDTLGERIVRAFKNSLTGIGMFLENLIIFLVGALPYLILLIPIGWVIWLLGVKLVASRAKKGTEDHDDGQ